MREAGEYGGPPAGPGRVKLFFEGLEGLEGLARPKEGGLGGYAHSARFRPGLSFGILFRTSFRTFFVAFFVDVFSRLWGGFRRHFGAILEVKIHKNALKTGLFF